MLKIWLNTLAEEVLNNSTQLFKNYWQLTKKLDYQKLKKNTIPLKILRSSKQYASILAASAWLFSNQGKPS